MLTSKRTLSKFLHVLTIACIGGLGSAQVAQAQVTMPNRPFGVDPDLKHIHLDGFFDVTIDDQIIGVYLLNEGLVALNNVSAQALVDPFSGIVITEGTADFGTLEPGIPVLGFFRANFGSTTPGSHELTVRFDTPLGPQFTSRKLFVAESVHDPFLINRWTMNADIGAITTTANSAYGGPVLPTLTVVDDLVWEVDYTTPFPGQIGPLPYEDPFWKAFALGFGIGGCIGWVAGEIIEACGDEATGKLVRGTGQACKGAGGVGVAADFADPIRRGQENTFPLPLELTTRETVRLSATFPTPPLVGTPWTTNVSWTYTRFTNFGTHTYGVVNETLTNEHFTLSRHVNMNATSFRLGEEVIISAQADGGLKPLINNTGYFCANITAAGDLMSDDILAAITMRDDGHAPDVVPADGIYTGAVHTSMLPPGRPLDVFIFGFDMNNAAVTDPPIQAAQKIGGILVSPPSFGLCVINPDFQITVDPCDCDVVDPIGVVDSLDLLAYLSMWFTLDPNADFNHDLVVDVIDLLDYLGCWFPTGNGQPCP